MKKATTSFLILIFFMLAFVSVVNIAAAAEPEGVCFKPNVPIPGIENILGASCAGGQGYIIAPSSLGIYINALYVYAARLATVIAMFMIVLASWQWLMAAGNAGKIDNAKDTIRGVLIGLALLFAGQLLLNTISERFVNLGNLNIKTVESMSGLKEACMQATPVDPDIPVPVPCGQSFRYEERDAYCVGQACPLDDLNRRQQCVTSINGRAIGSDCSPVYNAVSSGLCTCVPEVICGIVSNNCNQYETETDCNANRCYDTTIPRGCKWWPIGEEGRCIEVDGFDCSGDRGGNSACAPDLMDPDTGRSLYCCDKDTTWFGLGKDECALRSWAEQASYHSCYPD